MINWTLLPTVVLRACSEQCSNEQFKEIEAVMKKRKLKLKEPEEMSPALKVNDIYFIAKNLGSKVKKSEFRKIANYVQEELNK